MSDSGPPCISCRLRRKKCNRQRPICSGCLELLVPESLCIYRENNGAFDRDALSQSSTLVKMKKRNRDLKVWLEDLEVLLGVVKGVEGHIDEIYTLRNNPGSGKLLQLNPQWNPLFSTLLETSRGDSHLGALSVASMLHTDPTIYLIEKQVNNVLLKERQKYNVDIKGMFQSQVMLDVFEDRCSAALVGMKVDDGDDVIRGLLAEIESKLPQREEMEGILFKYGQQNAGRYIGNPFVDPDFLKAQLQTVIEWDPHGKAHFKLTLPRDTANLEFLSLLMIILAWLSFVRMSRTFPRLPVDSFASSMNYVLYFRYSEALLRVNLIGQEIRLGDSSASTLTTMILCGKHAFERYSAVTNYLSQNDYKTSVSLTTRQLISKAKALHLHEDIDHWYPRHTLGHRRQLKSVWHNLVVLDLLDSLECGTVSSVQPNEVSFEDGQFAHPLTDAISAVHRVIYDFNFIDDATTLDSLIKFVDQSSAPNLQACYTSLCNGSYEKSESFELTHIFDSSKYQSDSLYADRHMFFAQRAMVRYLIISTICSMYDICLIRLIQNGEPTTSPRYQRIILLTLKYALACLQIYKLELAILHDVGNGEDPIAHSFYISNCVHLGPFISAALRRSTMIIFSLLSRMLGFDSNVVAKYILYGDLGNDDEILEMCREKGLAITWNDALYTFSDFSMDNNLDRLKAEFERFLNPRVLVATTATLFDSFKKNLKMKYLNVGWLKMSRHYVFGLKFLSYCLNSVFADDYFEWKARKGQIMDKDTDFGGSFKDLFDASIATKSDMVFSFSTFFGTNENEDALEGDIDEYYRRAGEFEF